MGETSPLIRTERLDLRDFRPGDFDAVHAYGSDPLVTRYTSWGPNTEEDTRSFLGFMAAEAGEQPRRNYTLAIVDRASGTLIGGCGVASRRALYREYETGYVLNRAWWGRGMVTEAMRGLLTFAFKELGAHRLYACVFPENEASRRVVNRLGFQLEGRFRRDALKHGEWKDSLIFALLEDEWR